MRTWMFWMLVRFVPGKEEFQCFGARTWRLFVRQFHKMFRKCSYTNSKMWAKPTFWGKLIRGKVEILSNHNLLCRNCSCLLENCNFLPCLLFSTHDAAEGIRPSVRPSGVCLSHPAAPIKTTQARITLQLSSVSSGKDSLRLRIGYVKFFSESIGFTPTHSDRQRLMTGVGSITILTNNSPYLRNGARYGAIDH